MIVVVVVIDVSADCVVVSWVGVQCAGSSSEMSLAFVLVVVH